MYVFEGLFNQLKELGIPSDKLRIVHSSIDKNLDTPQIESANQRGKIRKFYNISSDSVVYTVAGRISKEKNISKIITYWERFFSMHKEKDVYLFILGEADVNDIEMQDLHRKIMECYKINIVCTGWVKIDDFFSASDYILSMSSNEGLSNVALEACAREKPVIAPIQTSGFSDLITSGRNGILYDIYSEKDFINALNKSYLLRKSKMNKYREMAIKSRLKVLDLADNEKLCSKYLEIYQDAISKNLENR